MKYRITAYLTLIFVLIAGLSLPARAQTVVGLQTTLGTVYIELLDTEAPVTAQNFLSYVQKGSYDGTFFHRLENDEGVYLQGGGFIDTETYPAVVALAPITNESSISNTRGTLSMVPNSADDPDSITSQFVINFADNSSQLDTKNGGYPVFARIINGIENIEIATNFAKLPFDNNELSAVPIINQGVDLDSSLKININDAFVYDGDISDFDPDDGSNPDDGDDPDNGDTGDNDDDDTGTPGEGETLYEDAVCVDTNVGEFCMELLTEVAPETVENFLNYISTGRYDDTIVHRSVPSFVIQAGGYLSDPLGTAIQKDPVVPNEFSRSNIRGTVAMARLGGQVNSATSEWFVNVVNNTQLDFVDGGFTVFAEIISGMSVVDAISNLPRSDQRNNLGGAFGEVPLTDQDSDGVDADDLVLLHRVYVTDVIVDDSDTGGGDNGDGTDGPVTTATYSIGNQGFILPVYVGDSLYRVIMRLVPDPSDVIFSIDTTRIFSLTDIGQETASMDLDAGLLGIPSVNISGKVFTELEFELIELETLTFRLTSFTRPAE